MPPRQPRLLEPSPATSMQRRDLGERAPLLGEAGKHEKSGVSGNLSFLGKVWVWCCCGGVPAILLLGLVAVVRHRWAVHPSVTPVGHSVSSSSSASLPHTSAAWAPPPRWRTARGSHTAAEHDWADDEVEASDAEQATAKEVQQQRQPLRIARQGEDSNIRRIEPPRVTETRKRDMIPSIHHREPPSQHHATHEHLDVAPVVVPSKAPMLRHQVAAEPLVLTTRCALPVELNMICSGILKAALQTEQARIAAEFSKHLPPWVAGVALSFDEGSIVAEPTVRLSTRPERAIFGFDPQMRLRCTFESLMRSPKVTGATKLLSEYSGGLCSATTGTAHCAPAGSSSLTECDPIGDFLINNI